MKHCCIVQDLVRYILKSNFSITHTHNFKGNQNVYFCSFEGSRNALSLTSKDDRSNKFSVILETAKTVLLPLKYTVT